MKNLVTLAGVFLCSFAFSQSVWVANLVIFRQGLNNEGGEVLALRSDPLKSIGQAQASDAFAADEHSNYVSLGFGGEIELSFEQPVKNIEGFDIKVHETTYGNPSCKRYPEKIMLFASQDGCNWYFCGYGCQDTEFELGDLNWAQYVKIIDVSPYGNFEPYGICDGYDVDAVEGYAIESNPTPSLLVPGTAQKMISFQQGLRKNGTPVTTARSNPNNALGLPQGTEVVNFVSLGLGGQLVLKFDYTVFNQESFDFQITETSYGNPPCSQYPEKALVEVSMDGITWTEIGIHCLDVMIDMNPVMCFQYIRITDRSAATAFSGSADGYDVDGVFTFANCGNQQRAEFDDVVTMNDESDIVLAPNPFDEKITINTTTAKRVTVYNYIGSRVKEYKNVGNEINTQELPAGIYYFDVITPSGTTTHKLYKK
jgi:hypothetical protein